ncbi:MAG: alpha-galactosidase [Pirellulaceae bacterium]|nr:alpha-galactosidase [Pirellulaceae bacterium]
MPRILTCVVAWAMLALSVVTARARAEVVTDADLQASQQWVQHHLAESHPREPRQAELQVWSCHGGLLRNGRAGRPLVIADREFHRGLLAHAPSKIVVQLAAPGRTFSALVGLDSNERTRPGLGSVVFSVSVAGKLVAQSSILREGMPAELLSVDLGGATRFVLEASDAGDGIASDHADWADVQVVLADGATLSLGDVPEATAGDILPFSFTYGGTPAKWLLPSWDRRDESQVLDQSRLRRSTTWTDPFTGLEVRCVSIAYQDFPVVEWTISFRNGGASDTPILADIRTVDVRWAGPATGECVLHCCKGDACTPDSYQPYVLPLAPGTRHTFAPPGGRPTEEAFPYFNLAWPGGGVIAALGWPGQWSATFSRDAEDAVQLTAGQELTHFRLLPGESARTPLVALLFWQGGDWIRAQNIWRRWMVAHNLPRAGGQLVPTHYGSCWSVDLNPSAEEELAIVAGFEREGIHLDYYFIDAGWYPHQGSWWQVGTWEVDTARFPRGIREVADRVHQNGAKFVLWFEPERVVDGSWLSEHHPDWILSAGGARLVNLGHPDAWRWVVQRIDSLITSEGVDVYRQDFNMQPLACWRGADAPDRQGLTEMRHVEGYLAFWDELRRRHPDLYIDTCASGGRRNDLETLRRSVPLLRSDCFSPAEAQQAHTMGLALWMPYFGSGMYPGDDYWYRSCIFPASRVGMDTRRHDQDYARLKRMIAEFRQVEPFLLGDFYPLTPHSLGLDVWVGWQYDRPEQGAGILQVFRRGESPYETARLRLRGLDPAATYCLQNFDENQSTEHRGADLMETGVLISLPQPRSSCIIRYERRAGEQ